MIKKRLTSVERAKIRDRILRERGYSRNIARNTVLRSYVSDGFDYDDVAGFIRDLTDSYGGSSYGGFHSSASNEPSSYGGGSSYDSPSYSSGSSDYGSSYSSYDSGSSSSYDAGGSSGQY